MKITGINNNAGSVRVINHGARYTKAGLLAYARNVNAAKYADIGTDKSILTHGIDGGAMSIKHKKPERKEHTLYITQTLAEWSNPLDDDMYLFNIIAVGNHDYNEFNEGEYSELYARIKNGIDDMAYELEHYIGDCGYKNATECINDWLGVKANTYQVGKVKKLLEYGYCNNNILVAEMMTLFTPHKWETMTIRGYCQSDWCDIIYPADVYNKSDIDTFEAYFFGMYMEYRATFEEEDVWYTFCDFEGEDAIIKAISGDFGTSKVKYFSYY